MSEERILVVDDDAPLLEVVGEILSREGYRVETAETWRDAEQAAARTPFDLFLLDYKMPEVNGIDLMKRLRKTVPGAEAIIITGYPTIEKGVEAIREGARDYVTKPIEGYELLHRIESIMERRRLRHALRQKDAELQDRYRFNEIVGVSGAMAEVRELGRRAAAVMSNVLIEGESGTGKEVLARCIHYASKRSEGPFVAVNCGAIAPGIAERELFGHERGAFTGAGERQMGYFEAAQGGTLFLDEIGELPLDLQVKLLRAIDNQEILRVGATKPLSLDVRLLFATNRHLETMVEKGTFRNDLYYRINVIRIAIAPLRERREDIPLLATTFIRRVCERIDVPPKTIAEDAVAVLEDYRWPGNARELENVIERAVALTLRDRIEMEDLPGWVLKDDEGDGEGNDLGDFMAARRQAQERFDRRFLARALEKNDGNVSRTAREIGIARTALQRFLRKYDIDRNEIEVRETAES